MVCYNGDVNIFVCLFVCYNGDVNMFKPLYTIALKSISYVPYGLPYTTVAIITPLFEEK